MDPRQINAVNGILFDSIIFALIVWVDYLRWSYKEPKEQHYTKESWDYYLEYGFLFRKRRDKVFAIPNQTTTPGAANTNATDYTTVTVTNNAYLIKQDEGGGKKGVFGFELTKDGAKQLLYTEQADGTKDGFVTFYDTHDAEQHTFKYAAGNPKPVETIVKLEEVKD